MRLLALALSLFALSAPAQRVDTRVIDVRQKADGRNTCRFNAVPDLTMTEGRSGTRGAFAEWTHRARGGDAWLHARFSPEDAIGRIVMIEIKTTRTNARAASARLLLDGAPSPLPATLAHARDRWTLTPGDGAALAEAMRYTDTLEVVLHNAAGRHLASYAFTIGDLQDIAEYPSIIAWRCRNWP